MKVSIITATYNREKTISRSLNSIKRQTYNEIQKIVIDGDSNDKTISLITPFLNKNDVLVSEPDNGIYQALNKGLALSKGEIIGFLHSDDLYFDEKVISKVVKIFLDDSIDIVYGDVCFFSADNVNNIKRKYKSHLLSKRNLAWGKMPPHPAIFIRKRVYEHIGNFRTDFNIASDYDFLCRVLNYPNLKSKYFSSLLVKMQLGGASTSGLKSLITLNMEVLRALKANDINTNIFMILSKYPSKLLEFFRL